jgi:hypothetical protein
LIKSLFRQIVLTASYLLLTIIVIEVLARTLVPVDWLTQNFFGRSETVWRLAWVQDMQNRTESAPIALDQHDDVLGWRLKPNLDLQYWEDKHFQTNSSGIRGDTEYLKDRNSAVIRVAMIGDSFTLGEEVGESETFSYQLQELWPHAEVINFGVGGYGIDQVLLQLESTVPQYRPDVVVMGFIRDDMRRSMWRFRHHSKPLFELGAELVLTNVPVPDREAVLAREKFRLRSWDILNVIWDEIRWRQGWFDIDMVNLGEAIMTRMLTAIEAMGAQAVFVYLPHSEDLVMTYERFYSIEEQFFNRFCEQRQLECLNLRGEFHLETSLGYQVKVGGHWFYNGHALVAKYINAYLEAEGLIERVPAFQP